MNAKELSDDFALNIAELLIAPITIATPDGAQDCDALILGDWALNQNKDGWTVTHRKSGYAGKSFLTPIEALISLGIYLGAGVPNDFTIERFKDIPDIHNISARIKSAITTLDSWDLDLDYNEPNYEP